MEYLLKKYELNIKALVSKVKIYPKDYKQRIDTDFYVYFDYKHSGSKKRRKYKTSTYDTNGQTVQINRLSSESKTSTIELLRNRIIRELKTEPRFILHLLYGAELARQKYPEIFYIDKLENENSIESAFNKAVEIKKTHISHDLYLSLKSHSDKFLESIGDKKHDSITSLTKLIMVEHLNDITKGVTGKTFNNYKSKFASILTVIVDLGLLEVNYLKGIKNKKVMPATKNKAFSQEQVKMLFDYMKKENKLLYFYCMHVYYSIMRQSTVSRLRVKDINLERKFFDADTKTGGYFKNMPEKLIEEFYTNLDLKNANPEHLIFGRRDFLKEWNVADERRVKYYGSLFTDVKKVFKLDKDYTIKSFRHSAIGKAFDNMYLDLKEQGDHNYKNKALDHIMEFTNHTNHKQVKNYLRGVSMEIHEDISSYL